MTLQQQLERIILEFDLHPEAAAELRQLFEPRPTPPAQLAVRDRARNSRGTCRF